MAEIGHRDRRIEIAAEQKNKKNSQQYSTPRSKKGTHRARFRLRPTSGGRAARPPDGVSPRNGRDQVDRVRKG